MQMATMRGGLVDHLAGLVTPYGMWGHSSPSRIVALDGFWMLGR